MKPTANQIICGSNIDVVKSWPANCIDGICTDPPYGLGFMGKEWDTFKDRYINEGLKSDKASYNRRKNKTFDHKAIGSPTQIHSPAAIAGSYDFSRNSEFQQWFTVWAKAMLRITKPGGFLFCFGGTRTNHRLACAIEDAGWEIRDCMMWLYGSGFPKSHNISKAIDKAKGQYVKGKILPSSHTTGASDTGIATTFREKTAANPNPQTELAKLWDGYGTALKPAWEPIIVAMKPLDGTFAHNAEAHGVAGLNIDGGRIGTEQIGGGTMPDLRDVGRMSKESIGIDKLSFGQTSGAKRKEYPTHQGRWPANLLLDSESAALLDEQTGTKKSRFMSAGTKRQMSENPNKNTYGKFKPDTVENDTYGDSGGASRFFKRIEGPEPCFLCGYIEEHGNLEVGPNVYLCDECSLQGEALDLPKRFLYCAKTSRKERNMGLDDQSGKKVNDGRETPIDNPYQQGETIRKNTHPTVKPLALMKYLCTLLKMPSAEQIILDPFLGSGTTAMACASLGIGFIGIEKELEYCEISAKRIAAITGKPLPVTKNVETVRAAKDFAGNQKQKIINDAVAKLKGRGI